MPVTDTGDLRLQFPALERVHNGYPVAYFDGPGGTQVPRAVSEAMVDYLHHHNANTHWPYPTSVETDEALDHARSVFAKFLKCQAKEVVFGANMTTLTLHMSRALARSFPAGAEVVITELDHHANMDPWRELEKDSDVRVRTVRLVPETGRLDWDDLAQQLSGHTALLAIGAASNALGTVTDVRRATDMAHAVGALAYVDGVHYAPHRLPDVEALGADMFVCSPYKFYGPHLGVMCGSLDLLEALDPPRLLPAGQVPPERFETGTLNHEGIVGAAAGVEWLASLSGEDGSLRARLENSYAELGARGEKLVDQLWSGLSAIDAVRLYGPPPGEPRTDTLVFTVMGHSSESIARFLADKGVFVSNGDFYAQTVVERLGLQPDGLVRIGCACYTTREEVDRVVAGVREVAKGNGL
jgi:cysteine desulfurase family protein (TIGR01976 family)